MPLQCEGSSARGTRGPSGGWTLARGMGQTMGRSGLPRKERLACWPPGRGTAGPRARRRTPGLLALHHADEGQVAVTLSVVEPIAHHEDVVDNEALVVDGNLG